MKLGTLIGSGVSLVPVLVGALCLTACSSTKPLPAVVKAPTPAFIPIEDEANVRIPEQVKAYPFERYVDPTNPQVMHERHVVYRIEQPSTWRLQTSAERQILIGATVSDGRLEKQPLLLPNQLGAQLAATRNSVAEQKRATDDVAHTNQQLLDTQSRTAQAIHDLAMKIDARESSQEDILSAIQKKQAEQDEKIKQALDASQHPAVPIAPTPIPKPTATPLDTNNLGL